LPARPGEITLSLTGLNFYADKLAKLRTDAAVVFQQLDGSATRGVRATVGTRGLMLTTNLLVNAVRKAETSGHQIVGSTLEDLGRHSFAAQPATRCFD
jgi:hypothetical protein